VEIKHRDGRLVPIRLSAVMIMEDGREVGSVGFFHDLTRQRQLENELRRLSITDSLTGLANRRHFHGVLSEEVARSERYGRPLSLICLDLDHFKPFNDNFGHQEGDNILRLLGDCARGQLRSQDHAFRVGGDEFMLLLAETGLPEGLVAANRFRESFNDSWPRALTRPSQGLHPVTLSLGVAQYVSGERSEGLTMRADLAMYEAKRAGGDRAAAAQEQISQAECRGER
jgi:diguanylate cyclase (GGDEF)-like protein